MRILNTQAAALPSYSLGRAVGSGAMLDGGDPASRARRDTVSSDSRIDAIARTWTTARAEGLARGWSLESWEADLSPETMGPEDARECRARARLDYVNSRQHRPSAPLSIDISPDVPDRAESLRNPWRACESPLVDAVAAGAWRNGTVMLQSKRAGAPPETYLRMHERGLGDFPVRVTRIPNANIAMLLDASGTPVEPPLLLQRNRDGWRPLGQLSDSRRGALPLSASNAGAPPLEGDGVVDCSGYRMHAVAPAPAGLTRTLIYAGDDAFSGETNTWHRAPVDDAGNASPPGNIHEPEPRENAYALADVLNCVQDDEILQIGADRFYAPLRDGAGRFWVTVGKTADEAARIADTRSSRCLEHAVFLRQRVPQDGWVQQPDATAMTARCHANGTLIALHSPETTSLNALRIGTERASGIVEFRTRSVGGIRYAAQNAIETMRRNIGSAWTASKAPTHAAQALAPLLASLPRQLHAPVIARIEHALRAVEVRALEFELTWADLKLVDGIEGAADYCAQDGFVYLAPSFAARPTAEIARFLLEVIVGKIPGRVDLFRDLGDMSAMLSRAGRFIAYDPTLMQSMLTWPDREHIANELKYIYPSAQDQAHPLDAVATPRRADLQSEDGTDNLSILLRDNASMMSLIGALSAESHANYPANHPASRLAPDESEASGGRRNHNVTCPPDVDASFLLHGSQN